VHVVPRGWPVPYVGGLVSLLAMGLWVFCIIDALTAPEEAVRNLPKLAWVFIVLIPPVGPIAWLVAGRPTGAQPDLPYKGNRGRAPWPATRTAGFPEYERPRVGGAPEDDPVFLDRLRQEKEQADAEHEDMLRRWEADLRRREENLRRRDRGDSSGDTANDPDGSAP
jgi:hypothetical protein